MLTQMLNHPALEGPVVSITLHNTQEPATAELDTQAATLACMSRVVVHSLRDMNTLAAPGLTHNTTLIPQGATPPLPGPIPRPLTPQDPVVLGSYGFFLPGKGPPELIEALALLHQHWPRALLRLIKAEYPAAQSAAEIATCRAPVTARGLDRAVLFETAFLDFADSTNRLQKCDLLVLPYQGSREGSSAALRSALVTGVPVVVTPLALFEEAGPAVLTLPGTTPAAIAAGLGAALRDHAARTAVAVAGRTWLQERAWDRIGTRFGAILTALRISGLTVD